MNLPAGTVLFSVDESSPEMVAAARDYVAQYGLTMEDARIAHGHEYVRVILKRPTELKKKEETICLQNQNNLSE